MTTFEWQGTHEGQLRRALRVRHLVMLSVGGTIVRGLGMMLGLETVRDRSAREPADRGRRGERRGAG
jgi:4-aminobutyrate aminotransferase-like enzyme